VEWVVAFVGLCVMALVVAVPREIPRPEQVVHLLAGLVANVAPPKGRLIREHVLEDVLWCHIDLTQSDCCGKQHKQAKKTKQNN